MYLELRLAWQSDKWNWVTIFKIQDLDMKMSVTLCCDSWVIIVNILNHASKGSDVRSRKNFPQKRQEHFGAWIYSDWKFVLSWYCAIGIIAIGFTDQETEAHRTGQGLSFQGVVQLAERSSQPGSAVPLSVRNQPQLFLLSSTHSHWSGRTEVPFPDSGVREKWVHPDSTAVWCWPNTSPLKAWALSRDTNSIFLIRLLWRFKI